MAHLIPQVTVYVHPVDATQHPTYPDGWWRWAVHIGGTAANDLTGCVGAGAAPTDALASVEGEAIGAAVAISLRRYGTPAKYSVQHMDWDPIPASADHVPLLKFGTKFGERRG